MNLFSYIKQKTPILDVVSQYVSLKRAGMYWKSSCPFHAEKTASFTVSPHRDIFYCFGCHKGGDAIEFICAMEQCSPLEAAKFLAERHQIAIPQELASPQQEQSTSRDEKKRYFELSRLVADWCHEQLKKHVPALRYIAQRGITEEQVDRFCLGYLPACATALKELIKCAHQQAFSVQELYDMHFIFENRGLAHSPFEQRILFPIQDHLGRFCGFGGRIFLPGDERPKYYNSHDTPYFQKGSLLFGMDKAKKSIQQQGYAFLVEGYTDCIAMVQHGQTNTVATLGTACTLEHLQLLSNHAEKVYVLYDGDSA